MRNSFAFCLQRVALYFKDMLNSIDFCERIFLHVIPACITVPWFNKVSTFSCPEMKMSVKQPEIVEEN